MLIRGYATLCGEVPGLGRSRGGFVTNRPSFAATAGQAGSGAEADGGAGFGFGSFFFATLWRGVGGECVEEAAGGCADFFDCGLEGGFVGLGGLVEAGDLADVLERGCANFFRGDGRFEVEEGFDVSAHG